MRSLKFKLTIVVLGVSLSSVALVALFARWVTVREFDRFVTAELRADVMTILTDYYQTKHTWQGVLDALPPPPGAPPRPKPDAEKRDAPLPPKPPGDNPAQFALLDEQGCVVVPAGQLKRDDCNPQLTNQQSDPILVDGKVVGTLVTAIASPGLNTIEEAYLARTNSSILYSTLGAALLALLFGVGVARSLINPLQGLTRAVQAMASGDLKQEVVVTTQDELGELAHAFNLMSADLARANQARRQMTADIAHELRNPLMVMIGYIEAMRDQVLKPTTERLDAIYDEAQHLQRLVTDLRTLSLADAGELPLQKEATNAYELLLRVHQAYQSQARQKQITLTIVAPESLPEIEVDPERVIQVLSNLVNNAIRHTPAGGQIDLSGRVEETGIYLSVRDTGEGIPSEALPYVFDRLYRVDPSRQQNGAESGLGLAIVKSIIAAHNGEIQVESQVGKGTTFIFFLPLPAKGPISS